MKSMTPKTALLILLLAGLFLPSCKKDETVSLPSELFGSWSKTSSHYVDTFTFTATTVNYYGYSELYSEYHGGWDGDVAEVWLSENIFRMTDNMYFGWHIEGTTLYLQKTNPNAIKPVLTGEWWKTASYVLHKK